MEYMLELMRSSLQSPGLPQTVFFFPTGFYSVIIFLQNLSSKPGLKQLCLAQHICRRRARSCYTSLCFIVLCSPFNLGNYYIYLSYYNERSMRIETLSVHFSSMSSVHRVLPGPDRLILLNDTTVSKVLIKNRS